jgi:hypothetical protein
MERPRKVRMILLNVVTTRANIGLRKMEERLDGKARWKG